MSHEHDDVARTPGTEAVPSNAAHEGRDQPRLSRPAEIVPSGDGSNDPDVPPPLEAELIERLDRIETQLTITEDYSGLIPHPDHWGRYDDATRERILRMSEAFTTDESARRDRLVGAEVSEAKKGRQSAVGIMVVCCTGAFGSIALMQNGIGVTAAAVFLAVPVATVVRDFIRGRNGK